MGSLCGKEEQDEPLPPVVVDPKCVTGAQVSADGLRVTGEPSGIFLGIAMSVVFGNDKAYFEVRLSKMSDGADVLMGLGKRDAEVDKMQKEKMKGEISESQSWVMSAADVGAVEGETIGVAYDGEIFPATVSFYTEKGGKECVPNSTACPPLLSVVSVPS